VGILLILTLFCVAVFVIVSAVVMLLVRDRGDKRRKQLDERDDEQW
jgi:hypothetical protein